MYYFFPKVEVEIEVQEEDGHASGARSADQTDQRLEESDFSEEDSLFIPLTWAWKLPRSFYKGTDPEWQDFVTFAKDRPKHARVISKS